MSTVAQPTLPVLRFEFGSELIVEDITEHPIAIVAHAEGRSVSDKREIAARIVLACNSFDALTEANKKMREALADARLRFANLADGIYHGIGHKNEPVTWLREAQEGRDAIEDTSKLVTP